ncbi:sigma-70 family RNA polymerase sigma factor [Lacticaseibacillus yichunensis]|uniref:Sigma-70 family RNA polymerase sigma factor n=1 Tax=Lacticaseibacillus yichunensis TaxID=2486015 RepID=A0ABW4CP05_9LACO|nr:sigma-70 family RNA polymerase sigma factor [Lacticaseibacillus yichunensis]
MAEETGLILAAKAGDQEALMQLLDARQEKLYKTAFLCVHDPQDALDIVQDTSLQAFLSIHRLRQPQYFDTWLIRILINVSRHYYRRPLPPLPAPEQMLDAHRQVDLHEDLMQALAKVPAKYRVVLILFYFNELEANEIAAVLRVPTGTVKSRLNRGRKWLREKGGMQHEA